MHFTRLIQMSDINFSKIEMLIFLPLGRCPRLFITTLSSGNVNTPSSSLSKSINTSLKSDTCSSVNCHSACKNDKHNV